MNIQQQQNDAIIDVNLTKTTDALATPAVAR